MGLIHTGMRRRSKLGAEKSRKAVMDAYLIAGAAAANGDQDVGDDDELPPTEPSVQAPPLTIIFN
jgi:hypothetical protein